jgi:hypothetical protein
MLLLPKIFTYAFNAYLDAQIAEELVTYIRTNGKAFATSNTIAQQRAEKLVTSVNTLVLEKNPSYLIGLAYTEYYVNGLADILYLDLIWSLMISEKKDHLRQLYKEAITHFRQQLTTPYQFEEIIHRSGISIWYWPAIVTNPWRWVTQFARERCNYEGILNEKVLRKACVEVQYQNSQNNREIAHALRTNIDSHDPKVLELRRIGDQLNNAHLFLSQAAATQEAAARWDKLFILLINR